MNNTKTFQDTLSTIKQWEEELNKYDFNTLLKKPDEDSWSMGQVYKHLINATVDFHLKQLEICLKTDENKSKRKNFKGFMTYTILKSLPNVKIKVPPSDAYTPKQPKDKEELFNGLELVKKELKKALNLFETYKGKGKTAHPGLSFLNAEEWFKLVEMHFRHHLRQKERLDMFLNH